MCQCGRRHARERHPGPRSDRGHADRRLFRHYHGRQRPSDERGRRRGYADLSDDVYYSEDEKWHKFTYDFATQGGANADTFNVCILPKCFISDAFIACETDVAGSSATIEVGISGNTDGIIDQTAEAVFVPGACVPHNETEGRIGWAEDDAVIMTIGTADLTAGLFT